MGQRSITIYCNNGLFVAELTPDNDPLESFWVDVNEQNLATTVLEFLRNGTIPPGSVRTHDAEGTDHANCT